MNRPTTLADVDHDADCETHGHVFGLIRGNVRHCERYGCDQSDGYDPDDFSTADGDLYDWDDPDRDELGYDGDDAYVLRVKRDISQDVLAQREGASTRTNDQLTSVFIADVVAIIEELAPRAKSAAMPTIPDYVQAAMVDADEHGWCKNVDNSEALFDMIPTCESWLSDFTCTVVWDDGYVIYNTAEWTDSDWEAIDQ